MAKLDAKGSKIERHFLKNDQIGKKLICIDNKINLYRYEKYIFGFQTMSSIRAVIRGMPAEMRIESTVSVDTGSRRRHCPRNCIVTS